MAVRGRLRGVLAALETDDEEGVRAWLRHPMTHLEDTELEGGRTALLVAAAHGAAGATRLLLDAGADALATDGTRRNALHAAAAAGALECLEALLQHLGLAEHVADAGADAARAVDTAHSGARAALDALDQAAVSPAAAAAECCGADCMCARDAHAADCAAARTLAVLARAGASLAPAGQLQAPLLYAATRGAYGVLRQLLQLGVRAGGEDGRGGGRGGEGQPTGDVDALFLAAEEGHTPCVRLLLEAGAGTDACRPASCAGATALWAAAQAGHSGVVAALLAHGADASAALPADGASAVFVAAQNGHTAVLSLLLRAGADADAPRQTGATPLYAAAQGAQLGCVRLLLAHGVRDAVGDGFVRGYTALDAALAACAAEKGAHEAARVRGERVAATALRRREDRADIISALRDAGCLAAAHEPRSLVGRLADVHVAADGGTGPAVPVRARVVSYRSSSVPIFGALFGAGVGEQGEANGAGQHLLRFEPNATEEEEVGDGGDGGAHSGGGGDCWIALARHGNGGAPFRL
eukprot:g3094.t1